MFHARVSKHVYIIFTFWNSVLLSQIQSKKGSCKHNQYVLSLYNRKVIYAMVDEMQQNSIINV